MVDRVTVAVITTALRATAWEMSEAIRRSSHSPIIREMLDFSCAVFTPGGETVAQDELIPAFLGTMASTMPFVIEEAKRGHVDHGDVFISNDPYKGGTHTPDVQLFAPVIHEGVLIAWCGNIAHHVDVGGTNPGTEGYANRSIFEEGVRIPPIRLAERGALNMPLLRLIEANIRDPQSTAGDLRAQMAAVRLGQRRVLELAARYGRTVLSAAMDAALDEAERRIASSISQRSDGVATAESWLDDDGINEDPVRIAASVEVRGPRVSIDLSGSAPQMEGGMNMSQTAAKAAILYAVKSVFDPEAPQSGAPLRCIDTELPRGSLANPRFPAAVSLRHMAVLRLADTLLNAFGQLYKDRAIAESFVGFSCVTMECLHPRFGTVTVLQDVLGGGTGAHAEGDGLSVVDVHLGNVALLPSEICELEYPVRILRTELASDTGGPGEFRGGLGLRRVYEFLGPSEGIAFSEQARPPFAPQGIAGGLAGTVAKLSLERVNGETLEFTKARLSLNRGDRLTVVTGGGGGFGDARRRQRSAVAADIEEGKVSERAAAEIYGYISRAQPRAPRKATAAGKGTA
jgi:N-methylhydantoinase B